MKQTIIVCDGCEDSTYGNPVVVQLDLNEAYDLCRACARKAIKSVVPISRLNQSVFEGLPQPPPPAEPIKPRPNYSADAGHIQSRSTRAIKD